MRHSAPKRNLPTPANRGPAYVFLIFSFKLPRCPKWGTVAAQEIGNCSRFPRGRPRFHCGRPKIDANPVCRDSTICVNKRCPPIHAVTSNRSGRGQVERQRHTPTLDSVRPVRARVWGEGAGRRCGAIRATPPGRCPGQHTGQHPGDRYRVAQPGTCISQIRIASTATTPSSAG